MKLSTAFLLVVATIAWAQDASVADPLERTLSVMADHGNALGIMTYLKQSHPSLYDAAARSGLAEVLTGNKSISEFTRDLAREGYPREARSMERALGGYRGSDGFSMTDLARLTGADPQTVSDRLYERFYSADRYHLREPLDGRYGTVHVEPQPGRLAWFNPDLSIPELGIRAGQPLTPEQERALLKMFSIKTTANDTGRTAFFPSDVGRAVNPNSGVLTPITTRGEALPELVSKGTGPTRPSGWGDGKFDINEGFIDAELSRALYRAGADIYVPVALIETEPGKAIYIRSAKSILRQDHIDGLTPDKRVKLVEQLIRNQGLRDGAGRPITVTEWIERELPRTSGRTVGLLNRFGVQHGSLNPNNYGLTGEALDWGWVRVGTDSTGQKDTYWRYIENTIRKVNEGLPPDRQADLSKARAEFERTYTEAMTRGNPQLVMDRKTLERVPLREIRSAFAPYLNGVPDDKVFDTLESKGLVRSTPPQQPAAARVARHHVAEFGKFAGALLIKDLLTAVETRDASHLRNLPHAVTTADFWKSYGSFVAAAGIAEKLIRGRARSFVPLAVGMAAADIVTGNFNARDFAINMGSLLVTSLAVDAFAAAFVAPLLFTGPPGWLALAAYGAVKLGVTLYLSDKLSGFIKGLLDERKKAHGSRRQGFVELIEKLGSGH